MVRVAPPATSVGLLARLTLPGSEAAWRRFVDCYRPYTEFACRKEGLQPADVDEVTGRVLFALCRSLPRFRYDPAKRFRGYLTRVIRNAVRTYWEEAARRPGSVAAGSVNAAEWIDRRPDLDALADDLDERVRAGLALLDRALTAVRPTVRPDTWQVFSRTALGGEDAAAVAADLGKTVAAVYMAKSRTLKLVRDELDRLAADPDPARDRPSWIPTARPTPDSAAC